MKNLIAFTLIVILFGCNSSKEKEVNKIDSVGGEPIGLCRDGIPNTNRDEFLLTLSLNKCFKNINQTIFVESTDNKLDDDFFALGAEINPGRFRNGIFKNVKLKNFKFKKLSGGDYVIKEVSKIAHYNKQKKQYEIIITLTDFDEAKGNKTCKIPELKSTDRIEVLVYKDVLGKLIGPRICTNYIGSLPLNN